MERGLFTPTISALYSPPGGSKQAVILATHFLRKQSLRHRRSTPLKDAVFISHTEGKCVWGHQVVQLMMKSVNQAFPYDFRLFKKNRMKVKSSCILNYYRYCHKQYNQPIYCVIAGIRMQVKQFAIHIAKKDTDLVTVG